MASGIYTAMGAARAQEQRLDTLTNNLANAQTAGYKRHRAVYREVVEDLSRMGDANQAMDMHHPARFLPRDRVRGVLDERYTEWTQGPMKFTQNPLDMALEGEGFFVLGGENGEPLYTRDGSFSLSRDGALVTQTGRPVLDVAGQPIRVPDGTADVHVSPNGTVQAGEAQIGQLAVVQFADPRVLARQGDSEFVNSVPDAPPQPGEAKVHQGYLEGSNINPVYSMTLLIKTNRLFELNMRALQTYKQMDDQAARDVGRTS